MDYMDYMDLDFLYRWPKVRSISWTPHFKSMGGGDQLAHFSQILVVIAISIMDDISHDHPRLSRCDFGYVSAVRSCDVIKGHQNVFFLQIASHRKELQHRAWSHCVQLIKTYQMIYILTLRSRKGHVTCELMTLTLRGHDIHISMLINERSSMVL